MRVSLLAQPYDGKQLGAELLTALNRAPQPTLVTIVSAFVGHQPLRRIKKRIYELHNAGTQVRFVVGVDMGGTSQEVLRELATWPVEVFIYKNRRSRVTFHPKLYFIEAADRADLFVGSNNLTDGGLYTNYEGAVHVEYGLPQDKTLLDNAKQELNRFLSPTMPIARKLDAVYLAKLLVHPAIPSEEEARKRKAAAGKAVADIATPTLFGTEDLLGAPALPKEVLDVILEEVANQIEVYKKASRRTAKGAKGEKKIAKINVLARPPSVQLYPRAFYMQIVKTADKTIPGEQRIPLEAVAAAREFWHWPVAYSKSVNPRKGKVKPGGKDRVYYNFRSRWRIQQVGNSKNNKVKDIRLYFYENSSDFRFYSRDVATWGRANDIVRITLSDEPGVVYDCQLAKQGTTQHSDWSALCTQTSSHTDRRYGFE